MYMYVYYDSCLPCLLTPKSTCRKHLCRNKYCHIVSCNWNKHVVHCLEWPGKSILPNNRSPHTTLPLSFPHGSYQTDCSNYIRLTRPHIFQVGVGIARSYDEISSNLRKVTEVRISQTPHEYPSLRLFCVRVQKQTTVIIL